MAAVRKCGVAYGQSNFGARSQRLRNAQPNRTVKDLSYVHFFVV